MRNKDVVIRKLEKVENLIVRLRQMLNQQEPRMNYIRGLENLEEEIEQIKDFVENEITE